jgi:hypothetical protein
MDQHVAAILFTDGVWRSVHEQADGRQYVIGGDGDRVYGVWFIPPDQPAPTVIVKTADTLQAAADFPCPRFAPPLLWQGRGFDRGRTRGGGGRLVFPSWANPTSQRLTVAATRPTFARRSFPSQRHGSPPDAS